MAETLNDKGSNRALAALQAYHSLTFPAGELGEPGDNSVFSEALSDLLVDLRWLCWKNGLSFPDLDETAGDRWIEELDDDRGEN